MLQAVPPPSRDELIESHLWLVKLIARNLIRRLPASFELDDLESEGTLGLLDACEKFDRSRGVPFRVYAAVRIRGQMKESVRRRHWRANTHLPITGQVLEMPTTHTGADVLLRDIEHAQRARIVDESIDALPDKDRKVIEIYFKRDGQLSGIGDEFGVRQSRSSQLLKSAKKRVADEIRFRGLRAA